jgi:hypothetical protein
VTPLKYVFRSPPQKSPPQKPQGPSPGKKNLPSLPPRPKPGHPLYYHMMQVPHGIALHDYTAQHDDELSFKVKKIFLKFILRLFYEIHNYSMKGFF